MPDALLLVTGGGEIRAANRRVQELGIDSELLVGKSLSELVSDKPTELQQFLRQCQRSRDEVLGALRFRHLDATQRCTGSLLQPVSDGKPCLVLLRMPAADPTIDRFAVLNEKLEALAGEIDRRKKAEASLRSQRDLAAFGRDIGIALGQAESMSGMLQTCAELIVRHLKAAFARIWTLSHSSRTLVLRASAGLYTHLDGSHSQIQIGQYKIGLIAQEQKPHLTNSVIGDPRVHDQAWAEANKMVAFAGYPMIVDGRTVGVIAMFSREVISESVFDALASIANHIALGTERILAETAVRRHAEALQRADRRKDEFLAMLGHELRNPLAPIRSGIELLRLESTQHEDTLALMNEHVQHITRLVDDLLDVSRIMRGRIKLKRQPVLLNELIQRAIESVRGYITERRHELILSLSDSPSWVDADPVRILQVLINLLNNAVKYTPDGGRIWVESRCRDEVVAVSVRDSGVGIDSAFVPQVFDLFAQADQSLDRAAGGLGIGLTLARRLIELHGGEISVVSEGHNKGSTFEVHLPMAKKPEQSEKNKRADPSGPEQSSFRILVVDDSVGSAKILRRLLTAVGSHDVEIIHDGLSVVSVAQRFRPEIIFLDIGLPGMDGYQVARAIRSKPEFVETTLVALTGYGAEDARERSRQAGFDMHLVKPMSLDQLNTVLSTADKSL